MMRKINRHRKKLEEIYVNSTAMLGYRVAGMKAGDLKLNAKNLKARRSLVKEEFGAWFETWGSRSRVRHVFR